MHPDIKKLNTEDPPPKGYKHPAYEITGSKNHWSISYLDNGYWNMPINFHLSEAAALRWLLDYFYYGPKKLPKLKSLATKVLKAKKKNVKSKRNTA